MAKSLKTLKNPTKPIEDYHSLPGPVPADTADKAVSKTYSLPTSMHQWLTAEAARMTVESGQRMTASRLLADIVREYQSRGHA